MAQIALCYSKFSSTMGFSQHLDKRPSSCQQRKKKKAKDDLTRSMAGSIMKFTSYAENYSGPIYTPDKEDPLHQDDVDKEMEEVKNDNDEDQQEQSSPRVDGRENFSQDESEICNQASGENDKGRGDLTDAFNWSIPLADNTHVEFIKQGSDSFQNKSGPFKTIGRRNSKFTNCYQSTN